METLICWWAKDFVKSSGNKREQNYSLHCLEIIQHIGTDIDFNISVNLKVRKWENLFNLLHKKSHPVNTEKIKTTSLLAVCTISQKEPLTISKILFSSKCKRFESYILPPNS